MDGDYTVWYDAKRIDDAIDEAIRTSEIEVKSDGNLYCNCLEVSCCCNSLLSLVDAIREEVYWYGEKEENEPEEKSEAFQ